MFENIPVPVDLTETDVAEAEEAVGDRARAGGRSG